MPCMKKGYSKNHQVKNDFQELIAKYGADSIFNILSENGLITTTETKKENIEIHLDEIFSSFLDSPKFKNKSVETQKTYKSILNKFRKYCETKFPSKKVMITEIFAPTFLMDYLDVYLNKNTKAKISACLRVFIRTTNKEYYMDEKESIQSVLIVDFNDEDVPKALSKFQLAELISLSKQGRNGLRNHAIIMTFVGSGIRLNGLRMLKIKDIDWKTQTLYIYPKGKSDKQVPAKITNLALTILEEYINFTYEYHKNHLSKANFRDLYVFSDKGGKTPLSSRTIQLLFSDLIKNAKTIDTSIETEVDENMSEFNSINNPIRKIQRNRCKYTIHSLRHTFSIYALESGLDIYTISRLLNHTSLSSTEKYLNLTDSQLRDAIEKHPLANQEFIKIKQKIDKKEWSNYE